MDEQTEFMTTNFLPSPNLSKSTQKSPIKILPKTPEKPKI